MLVSEWGATVRPKHLKEVEAQNQNYYYICCSALELASQMSSARTWLPGLDLPRALALEVSCTCQVWQKKAGGRQATQSPRASGLRKSLEARPQEKEKTWWQS